MRFSLKIFFGFLLLVVAALWISVQNFRTELVPGMRQSLEEVLVDTANLLAVIVQDEALEGRVADGRFARAVAEFGERRLTAVIDTLEKTDPSTIVYITDAAGIVVFDSRGESVGEDYSRWNDVYLTLRGEYGARTTRSDPADERSSVMYVAAPILDGERIVGVLTVGKPSVVVMPFVEAARSALLTKTAWLLLLSLLVGGLLSFGLTVSVRRLTRYAIAVKANRRVPPPQVREPELVQLADAMETMRSELEGKKHVEQYLHALTHELKSPLSAIEGALELLDEDVPASARRRFLDNIRGESGRLRRVVERLLHLAALESRAGLESVEPCSTRTLVQDLCADAEGRLAVAGVRVETHPIDDVTVEGEPFLLRQALGNLLDNAISFSPEGSVIELASTTSDGRWSLTVRDHGPGIPDYAFPRLFERFYSLPRPGDRPKSTGLGLAVVREIAELHFGSIDLANHPGGGAVATLTIPLECPLFRVPT